MLGKWLWLYYNSYFTCQSLRVCELFQAGSISILYPQGLNHLSIQHTPEAQTMFGRMDEKPCNPSFEPKHYM